MYCVYIHKNKINGKMYIGKAKEPAENRWKNGKAYREDQPCFKNAIENYGWNGFEHIIVKGNLTEEEAFSLEKELIKKYKTNIAEWHNEANGYNMTSGGDGVPDYEITNEIRQHMSEAAKNRPPMSEETREKMSKISKEKWQNPETRERMITGMKNSIDKEQRKQQMKNVWNNITDEDKEKRLKNFLSTERKEYKHSEETKNKISNSEKQKVTIIEINKSFNSLKECAEFIGVAPNTISNGIKLNSLIAKKYHVIKGEINESDNGSTET